MLENHDREQYFFDPPTVKTLADFAQEFKYPCLLGMPTVAQELARRKKEFRLLDIDERFVDIPGYRKFNLYKPLWTGEEHGIILVDPPFWKVKLSQLFDAIHLLSGFTFSQKLGITYLVRREGALLGTFARFGLHSTGYEPGYVTVQPEAKNRVGLYSNVDEHLLQVLHKGPETPKEIGREQR